MNLGIKSKIKPGNWNQIQPLFGKYRNLNVSKFQVMHLNCWYSKYEWLGNSSGGNKLSQCIINGAYETEIYIYVNLLENRPWKNIAEDINEQSVQRIQTLLHNDPVNRVHEDSASDPVFQDNNKLLLGGYVGKLCFHPPRLIVEISDFCSCFRSNSVNRLEWV